MRQCGYARVRVVVRISYRVCVRIPSGGPEVQTTRLRQAVGCTCRNVQDNCTTLRGVPLWKLPKIQFASAFWSQHLTMRSTEQKQRVELMESKMMMCIYMCMLLCICMYISIYRSLYIYISIYRSPSLSIHIWRKRDVDVCMLLSLVSVLCPVSYGSPRSGNDLPDHARTPGKERYLGRQG